MQKTSRDKRLSSTQKKQISKLREVGKNGLSAYRFHDGALAKIVALVEQICATEKTLTTVTPEMRLTDDIFDTSAYWFFEPLEFEDFVDLYLEAEQKIDDFPAVFELVYEVVKRRLRFQWIEENQELPVSEQLANRAVLENGFKDAKSTIANILWRKFWGTIDNRSAAEAGYLTEKVITSCLCGQSYSDKDSPITRFGEGEVGRQIDCIVEDFAYEVKTRITGAASGRGRSRDELSCLWIAGTLATSLFSWLWMAPPVLHWTR